MVLKLARSFAIATIVVSSCVKRYYLESITFCWGAMGIAGGLWRGKDALRSKEFQRLFEDIRLKRVNVILAGSLDRVSRSVKDFQHLLEVLTKEEVELISLKA